MVFRTLLTALLLAPQPILAAQVRSMVPVRNGFSLGSSSAGASLLAPLSAAPSQGIQAPTLSVAVMPHLAVSAPLLKISASPDVLGIAVFNARESISAIEGKPIASTLPPAQALQHPSTVNPTTPKRISGDETISSPRIAAAARSPHAARLKTLGSALKEGTSPSLAAFFDQSRRRGQIEEQDAVATGRSLPVSNLLTRDAENSPEPSFTPPQPHPRAGLGASAVHYTIYLSLLQVGLGVYTPIWPGLAMERFGTANYGLASSLAVLSMPVAAYLGKWLGERLGVKYGLAASLFGTATALTLVFGAFGFNTLSWGGLLAGLIAVQGLFALMRTLDRGVPTALYGRDQKKLQTFNALTFAVSRIPGILVPMAVGGLVSALGSFGTLSLFPLALLAALPFILLLKTKGIPASGPPEKIGAGDAQLLHLAGLGFASQQIMTYVVPFIVASAWGAFANPGDALAAKSAAGILMGFWTLGTLLGTLHLLGMFRFLTGKFGQNMSNPNPSKKLRTGALIGALGFLGYFPLMLTIPWAAYLAMIPAGFAGAYSFLLYLSAAQASAPSDRSGVVARYMIYSFAVVAAAVWGIAALIQAFPGSYIPFAALSAGLALLGLGNLYIYRKLP